MARQKWTDATSAAREKALRACRGCYQRNLIEGRENLSGSTLRGAAKSWGAFYARSRANLFERLRKFGVRVEERIEGHGARILVLRETTS